MTLHVLSALLAIYAMASYEIAVPLVALSGIAYLVARPLRPAMVRAAADVGLAVLFVGYRLVLDPVPDGPLKVERSVSESLSRAGRLLEATWDVWRFAYAPGGALILVGLLAFVAATVAALDARFRRRALPWLLMLAVAVVGAIACALVFLPAHDTYVPDVASTFNRLNLPGTLSFGLGFTALTGLGFELVRRFSPLAVLAPLAVIVLMLGVGKHQTGVGRQHELAWEQSWRVSSEALAGYRVALAHVPTGARIVGFDTPLFEQGWIPNLSTTWDLRGAIDYETQVDPAAAIVWQPGMSCGPDAVLHAAGVAEEYDLSGQPVYFVSPRRQVALHVTSQRQCERTVHAGVHRRSGGEALPAEAIAPAMQPVGGRADRVATAGIESQRGDVARLGDDAGALESMLGKACVGSGDQRDARAPPRATRGDQLDRSRAVGLVADHEAVVGLRDEDISLGCRPAAIEPRHVQLTRALGRESRVGHEARVAEDARGRWLRAPADHRLLSARTSAGMRSSPVSCLSSSTRRSTTR